jgi:branched-chain amino acid transport system substrate-binding protein
LRQGPPHDDPVYGKVTIREDGPAMLPVYLLQAKSPAESHEDWDYFKVVAPIPAERAFRPLSEGKCPLVSADH